MEEHLAYESVFVNRAFFLPLPVFGRTEEQKINVVPEKANWAYANECCVANAEC